MPGRGTHPALPRPLDSVHDPIGFPVVAEPDEDLVEHDVVDNFRALGPGELGWRANPTSSFSQPPATSSTTAAAGEVTALNASWSHPVVSTSAAVAASRAPPTTKPE